MNASFSPRLAQAENVIDGFMWDVSGPQFLGLYALWFVLLFGIVLLLRWRGVNLPVVTILGLTLYEIPGLLRIFVFAPPYMHKWAFLIIMMVVGGIAFVLRVSGSDGTVRWWGNNCGSGGCGSGGSSSCGGGGGGCGGGGGGCGGCGGSS